MSWKTVFSRGSIAAAAALAASPPAQAGQEKVIHAFVDDAGFRPASGLVRDGAGNLYGTTAYASVVFKMTRGPQGRFKYSVLHQFNGADGDYPYARLILDTEGSLYGVTIRGGQGHGVVFKIYLGKQDGKWHEQVLHVFCPGNDCSKGDTPTTTLAYAGAAQGLPYDGVSPLYGTTERGGAHDKGTVYVLTHRDGRRWDHKVIHEFCAQGGDACSDGAEPEGGMVMGSSGELYGTALTGGAGNGGTIFRLTPAGRPWSHAVLYDFCASADCADGSAPNGALTMTAAGELYGITLGGGAPCSYQESGGCGVIFKLAHDGDGWHQSVLHSFCAQAACRDGVLPYQGLTLDAAGTLYGTTEGGGNGGDEFQIGAGTVFALSGTSYKVLYRFCALADCADGVNPLSEIVLDPAGTLFGTTSYGGSDGSRGNGTVFQLKH